MRLDKRNESVLGSRKFFVIVRDRWNFIESAEEQSSLSDDKSCELGITWKGYLYKVNDFQ